MSLILEKKEIYNILAKRIFFKSSNQLLEYLEIVKNNFYKFTKNCEKFQNNNSLNPFFWQIGHVLFFFDNLIFKNLTNCERLNENKLDNNFDSFITPLKYRDYKRFNYDYLKQLFNKIINILKFFIKNNKISNIESYLIMLGILHTDMHIEAFIFSRLNISNELFLNIDIGNECDKIIDKIDFIEYNSGNYLQGINDDKNFLIFDNEMPSFKKKINKFSISKYPITEYLFLQFVLNGGYNNKKYWCNISYKWKNKNNIFLPLYWYENNGEYYKLINNKKYDLKTNLPISNISFYEAMAYCRWKRVRLPTESEFEYVATNEGTTKFPWGNDMPSNKNSNLNYNNYLVSVNKFKNSENNKNVSQLIGNIWEWCEEAIYPYDGFKIDPVYREMSYPFFGFKKICKGGCFAVPDYLIHPKYRNAQYPDCREQFIGFRVCI